MDDVYVKWGDLTPDARARLRAILDDSESWVDPQAKDVVRPLDARGALLRDLSRDLPVVTFSFYVGDRDGDYTLDFVSENVEQVVGCSLERAMSMGPEVLDLIHPDDVVSLFESFGRANVGVATWNFDVRLRGNPGQRWRRYMGWAMPERTGEQLCWFGALVDVDSARRDEATSVEAREHYEAIFNASNRALVVVDHDLNVLEFNAKAAAVSRAEGGFELRVGGRVPLDPLKDEHHAQLTASIDAVFDGRSVEFDWSGPNVYGVERHYMMHILPLRNAAGEVTTALFAASDVTEQRRAEYERSSWESQIAHAQRVEALGVMAAGVAHDFNNMLMIISTHASMLGFEVEDVMEEHGVLVEAVAAEVDAIERTILRARSMTMQLLAFTGQQLVSPVTVYPSDALEGCARAVRPSLSSGVVLELELPEHAWSVSIDPSQLEQILTNMAINARDAIQGQGTITLGVRKGRVEHERVVHGCTLRPGEYVVFELSDDGCGISAQDISRIFDPFFTTKNLSVARGLGLASCFGIARGAGGAIDCVSEVGVGTTFSVWLPRAMHTTHDDSLEFHSSPEGSQRRILLAEDQDDLRVTLVRLLEFKGFTVVACADGEEVIDVLKNDCDFALLLTDVVMPNVGGLEAARAFSEVKPGVPVVYMSGFVDNVLFANGMEEGATFVQKPCSPSRLIEVLEEALVRGVG